MAGFGNSDIRPFEKRLLALIVVAVMGGYGGNSILNPPLTTDAVKEKDTQIETLKANNTGLINLVKQLQKAGYVSITLDDNGSYTIKLPSKEEICAVEESVPE